MKSLLLHASFWICLAVGFPITSVSSRAEANCPGNIVGMHFRLVAGALIIIPVKINRAGPFDFMVDTGSQLNVIDPSLAVQLGIKSQGKVDLIAVATTLQASFVAPDSLEVGSLRVEKPLAAVQDLGQIQAADPHIRGVLGENFLAHFNLLIDYPHELLCLDDANLMQKRLRGEHIPLVVSKDAENDLPFSERLVISVNLSGTGTRSIHLQVDSGSDGPILYWGNRALEEPLLMHARARGPEASDAQRAFALLPPQDMRIGSRTIRKIPFVTPVNATQNSTDHEEDGILATVLFRRVFINHMDRYVMFDPR